MQDQTPPSRATCRIGPLTLHPDAQILFRDSVALPVGRRAVSLLHRLVQTPGEFVGKSALYDAGWLGQIVEDSNLTVQISRLRRILRAEAPEGDRWIETLAGRGYRFTGPVVWQTETPATAHPGSTPRPHTGLTQHALSNIPVAVPLHFTGRAAALAELHAALTGAQHPPAVVALHGLRGVGKTILAAAYARQHCTTYRVTWWLRAETMPTLRTDLAALAIRLGWTHPQAVEDAAVQAALDGLRHDADDVLLIYDNAIDAASLRSCLPKAGAARVIITSNAQAWRAYATPIALALWPASVGADFLIARTGLTGQHDEAEALSRTLDGLPLAHEQAAAYIERLDISIAAYRSRFDAAPLRLLDDTAHAGGEYHNGLTVAKAFALAIEQAAILHPASEKLLRHLAVLAPEPIPVFLLREGAEALGEPLAAACAGDGLDQALAALRCFALISREAIADERDPALHTDCLRLHRLVRQIALAPLDEGAMARHRAALIAALARVFPGQVFNLVATWPRARRLEALATPLVATAAIPAGAESDAIALLDGIASFRHALADFAQARPLFERAHHLAVATFGPEHRLAGQTLNNLALLHRDLGDLAAALPLHRRALAIRETALGPDHPDTAVSLSNLANVLASLGDFEAARPLLERALAIWQNSYGETHMRTAKGMNNLARLLHQMGALEASYDLHARALSIRETVFGPSHPETANSLNNLALLRLDLGAPAQARLLAERAVGIAQAAFGADHPETAAMRANLARCLLAMHDPSTALSLAERALASLDTALAPGAGALRIAAATTAACLDALGRGSDAAAIRSRYLSGPAMVLQEARTSFSEEKEAKRLS